MKINKKLLKATVKRIAEFENPVELVNNMYGCHASSKGTNYFETIYG